MKWTLSSFSVTLIFCLMWSAHAMGQNRGVPLQGSYYEGRASYRTQFYTDREYMRMVMNCQATYHFVVDESHQVRGEGLAIFRFDFDFDWPLIQKQKIADANAFGLALDPNVALMLNPRTAAHRFDVSGKLVPERAAQPDEKPQPPQLEMAFKWKDESAQIHLILGGSPAGSGVPVAVGQAPAEGSVKHDIRTAPMYPFGGDQLTVELQRDPSTSLHAGRFDYDGPGGAGNVHVVVHATVQESINFAQARNPAHNHIVSPVGLYEGYVTQHARYFTDRPAMGMMLSNEAELWLNVDEQGNVRGEVLANYTLDFGIDWTLAKKTGVSMAKSMGLPIDPDATVVLDPATARQRFILEGELLPAAGSSRLLAPEAVTLSLRVKPQPPRQLRVLVLGQLRGAANPPGNTAGASQSAAAAAPLGRVIQHALLIDAPSPLGSSTATIQLQRRTAYGPYGAAIRHDAPGTPANTHFVVHGFLNQVPLRAELSACPTEWVPDLMTSTGTHIRFEAKLVGPVRRPTRWKFTVEESSHLPGMCNNANLPPRLIRQWQQKINDHSPDLLFDFRRYDGVREPRFKEVVGPPWNVLETKEPVTDSVEFQVSCLDFGAYGRLIAEADFGFGWVKAVVRKTGEPVAHIPYARNLDEAERHMAQAAKTYDGQPKFAGRLPQPDSDAEPRGNGFAGDGLSTFEEYRGFFVRQGNQQIHRRIDPDQKDLFVFMSKIDGQRLGRYLADFESASHLRVHRVGNDTLSNFIELPTRLVNFNSDERDRKPQTALRLTTGDLPGGIIGSTFPDNTGFGPPVNVTSVQVDWAECRWLESDAEPYSINLTRSTTIHELGHAVGIRHHGDTNYFTGSGRMVAAEGGQNSGHFGCAMRYNAAFYYSHRGGTPPPSASLYLGLLFPEYETELHLYELDGEREGLTLCESSAGTGRNAVIPNSHDYYCGNATRGNCQSQLVVNDRFGSGGSGRAGSTQSRADSPSASAEPGNPFTPETRAAAAATSPLSPGTPPWDQHEQSAAESQAHAGLSLDLDVGHAAMHEIISGEAMLFELHVSQLAPQPELSDDAHRTEESPRVTRLGSSQRPWTEQIEWLVLDDTGNLVPWTIEPKLLGKPIQTLLSDESQPGGTRPWTEPQVPIVADQMYSASFAIDDDAANALAAGTYRVFAAIATSESEPEARVLSQSLVVKVKDAGNLTETELAEATARRLLARARIAFRGEEFIECEKHCRMAIASRPSMCEAHLLLAQSLHRQQKLREALAAYNATLVCLGPELERMAEPPVAIMIAVSSIERQLGVPPPERQARQPGPLVSAELFGEGPAGKVFSPFSRDVARLVFSWRGDAARLPEPLEARWVAADVPGLPRHQLIETQNGEPGQPLGAFVLRAPEGGFASGSYRLEIGAAGRRLYVLAFEIRD